MAYLFGAYIDKNDNFRKNLKKIHGLGLSKSKMVSKILSLDEIEYSKLNDKKKLKLHKLISNNIKTGLLLQKHKNDHLTLLKEIKCYRGIRHNLHLPTNGQRTCTNNKTQKRLSPSRR